MSNFLDFIWYTLVIFAFIAYLMILFSIVGDLFRDHKLNGWFKALWIIFLIVFPFLAALVYLIARGKGMAERQLAQVRQSQEATDAYIRQTVGSSGGASSEIASAKALLDAGTISEEEFAQLKKKALA